MTPGTAAYSKEMPVCLPVGKDKMPLSFKEMKGKKRRITLLILHNCQQDKMIGYLQSFTHVLCLIFIDFSPSRLLNSI